MMPEHDVLSRAYSLRIIYKMMFDADNQDSCQLFTSPKDINYGAKITITR